MFIYNNDFYKTRHEKTYDSATIILKILKETIPSFNSVVDFGCGIGTFLSVAKELGAKNIKGFDGSWVAKEYLTIPNECFNEIDLEKKINTTENFDLAISLEVAEHLSKDKSDQFVETLCSFSDFVLFSAAIPGQTGIGHVNMQWLNYWIDKFNKNNYLAIDLIRKRIWEDNRIPYWYRQNILLFVKRKRIDELSIKYIVTDYIPPEIYSITFNRLYEPSLHRAFNIFKKALKNRIIKNKRS